MKPVILVPYPKPDYLEALKKAGADVKTVDASIAPDDALAGVDGILLTGGDDVEPALYNEKPHPTTRAVPAGRDELELALAKRAIARDLPLFAICRGVQVLNVAGGGTLLQDIPTEVGHMVPHDEREPRDREAHPVRVKPGSKLAEALASELSEHGETQVNSRHHQAVGTVAPGMEVTAVAPDGLAEAIEQPDRRFCVGVQFHPENFHASGRFSGLFDAFVKAAARTSHGPE
jgi:putative glutamine amidotransferase